MDVRYDSIHVQNNQFYSLHLNHNLKLLPFLSSFLIDLITSFNSEKVKSSK